jgi:Ion channel
MLNLYFQQLAHLLFTLRATRRIVDVSLAIEVAWQSQSSTLLYFSMITLSSVGYGGIVPVNPYVRFTAALESMIGIFYIAVVVARLVSSYRPARHRSDAESGPPATR